MSLRTVFHRALCILAIVATSFSFQASAQDEPKPLTKEEHDGWMAAKLTHAQQIFAHLTNGDLKSLEGSARRMQVMNILEHWGRDTNFTNKSGYQGQLNAFEFATKELIRHAGDNNVDGALKAYVSMSQSCVRCHQLIRDDAKP